jgi:hypothetical protein
MADAAVTYVHILNHRERRLLKRGRRHHQAEDGTFTITTNEEENDE